MYVRVQSNGKRRTVPGNHVLIYSYRCRECDGRGYVDEGRVRVKHRDSCSIWLRLMLTYPRFGRTLKSYRSPST